MRIAVVGVGGTGGYFGGLLARAGRDVTFIARGQTLATLRDHGLTVKSRVEGPFTIAVNATGGSIGAFLSVSVNRWREDVMVRPLW